MTSVLRRCAALASFALINLCAATTVASVATQTISTIPSTATLAQSGIATFQAMLSDPADGAVTWTLTPDLGTLSVSGRRAVYTAPANITQAQTVTVQAQSVSNPSKVSAALISLVPVVAVALNPPASSVNQSGHLKFAAAVTGTRQTNVTWSVSPSLGQISSDGVYAAPASVQQASMVTVSAVSQADPSAKASATVQVLPPANSITFQTGRNGLTSLQLNGVEYNYLYGENLATQAAYTLVDGTKKVYTPTCTSTFTPVSVQQNCVAGADSFTLLITYSTPQAATIAADIQVTNISSSDTLTSLMISTLGIRCPFDLTHSHVGTIGQGNPIDWVSFGSGTWAIWSDLPKPQVTVGVGCGWTNVCKNQPSISNVAPGQMQTGRIALRFGSAGLNSYQIAPDAYANYRAAYPPVVNWPDRRPIMQWFIADTSKRSATNPRGYLEDPTINATNISAFSTRAVAAAQKILSAMNARPVRPQGIVIWDVEGEEFNQPTTYIGDPRVFQSGYAPEMNAAADQIFSTFTQAGYKVGVTLRPQSIQWGTTLPSTCTYNADNNFKSYFIMVNNPYQQKFYACYDPAGVHWSLIPNGNGAQTSLTPAQVQAETQQLLSKAQYAHDRWGATLFYVDSSVWVGGAPMTAQIFRDLQKALPDSLFMPEESYLDSLSAAIPFQDPKNSSSAKFSPITWRWAYPNGAMAMNFSNCQGPCWTTNLPSFEIGQKIGDIPMYSQPGQLSAPQLTQIEAMIEQARQDASQVTVTDQTGAQHVFTGNPATVTNYPVKMRVYFADKATDLPASTMFCEAGQWLGETACSMNLTGMQASQIRYYDFAGGFVSQDAPVGP